MAEMEAYLIAAAQGPVQTLSAAPRSEQVRPILESLLQISGVPARRVQEIHWHGGEDEYWLNRLGEAHGFGTDLARFFWPVTPLLPHTILQLTARAVESGDRDLVLLAQESSGRAVALLLASPAAVGRHNLIPRARIGAKLSLSGSVDDLPSAAKKSLEQVGQELDGLAFLAAARPARALANLFPGAQWILPGADLPSGDLFLLAALLQRLEGEQRKCGLLLSSGPQKSGLATLLERLE